MFRARVPRLTALALSAAFGLAAPASAAMSVADFLTKVDALFANPFRALTSPDRKLLEQEGMAAMDQWRAQAHAPNACPPDSRKVDPGQRGFLAMIRAVPAAERATTSVAQAIIPPLNRRFPCR